MGLRLWRERRLALRPSYGGRVPAPTPSLQARTEVAALCCARPRQLTGGQRRVSLAAQSRHTLRATAPPPASPGSLSTFAAGASGSSPSPPAAIPSVLEAWQLVAPTGAVYPLPRIPLRVDDQHGERLLRGVSVSPLHLGERRRTWLPRQGSSARAVLPSLARLDKRRPELA